MFVQILQTILPFLKKSDSGSGKGKVCPNGHVMHPSWDQCPYCLEMQQAMMAGGGGGGMPPPPPMGQGTAMVDIGSLGGGDKGRGSSDKSREVCGWMVALNGQHKGEDFRLRVGKNVIGTAADCDIVLTDKKISRKHATIRYEGGEYQIADLDSSNGCFVNDEKVQKHDLIDNDIIKLGDIEFEFKCRAVRAQRE
ncbi:MAG TPA: FHA domain-containing protein [Myxococcales bacterium]|nr:FHA domain-containing protein [Myxococcales bacterium]